MTTSLETTQQHIFGSIISSIHFDVFLDTEIFEIPINNFRGTVPEAFQQIPLLRKCRKKKENRKENRSFHIAAIIC